MNNSIVEISPFAADVVNAAGSPTLLCILGGQLLINLKEAGERGLNGGTNYTSTSVSDIDFDEVSRLLSSVDLPTDCDMQPNGAANEESVELESSV